jgi:hypothetical protein
VPLARSGMRSIARRCSPAAADARGPKATTGRGGDSGAVGGSAGASFDVIEDAGRPHRNAGAGARLVAVIRVIPVIPVVAAAAVASVAGPTSAVAAPAALPVDRGAVLRGFGEGRGPPVETRSELPAKATSTAPSVSVRKVRPATPARRSRVAGAGWPYELPAPADTTATFGRAASRNGSVLAVLEPWWATLRRSTVGIPRARSSGSTPSSTSPMRRNRCGPISPSSTIETLLIAVPPSGGRSGTRFGSGQSTRNRIESSVSRSPVESRPCGVPPPSSTSLQAS